MCRVGRLKNVEQGCLQHTWNDVPDGWRAGSDSAVTPGDAVSAAGVCLLREGVYNTSQLVDEP